jgi:hypothetical protein
MEILAKANAALHRNQPAKADGNELECCFFNSLPSASADGI